SAISIPTSSRWSAGSRPSATAVTTRKSDPVWSFRDSTRKEGPMDQTIQQFITSELVPLVRAALREGAEVRAAVRTLTERVETLTAELAEGEVAELRKLVGRALRTLEAAHV